MKALILISLATLPAQAARSLENHDDYLRVMQRMHVEGDKAGALAETGRLARSLAAASPLKASVAALTEEAEHSGITDSLEQAIRFATGTKREIYCEGKGLVEMNGRHNDGAFSRVVLRASGRQVRPDHPAFVTGGSWVYELSNTYREPVTSEVTVAEATDRSFHVKETRARGDGREADEGEGRVEWAENGEITKDKFSGNGDVREPIPMYMGIDFHHWGNSDLGYRLRFEPGYGDTNTMHESGTLYQSLLLRSKRTVGARLPRYEVQDSEGETRAYEGCYPVDYEITLERVIDERFEVEGEIDAGKLRKSFEAGFMGKAGACYRNVLRSDPALRGSVHLVFGLDTQGRATDIKNGVSMNGGRGSSDKLLACLMSDLRAARFLPSQAGKPVSVRAKIRFSEGKARL